MASFRLVMFFFAAVSTAWTPAAAEDALAQSVAVTGLTRERRHLHKKKLCLKYGICEGYGGIQGGYHQGGFQGGYGGGYGGYQGGYGQPPINIAISQSQSSANQGGGGLAHGQYPNNYQYNGGYPNHGGYHQGGYGGPGGFAGPGGYGGHQGGPGYFGNGQGAYNNQFNGNYYGPVGPNGPPIGGGGYGFQKPGFGPFFDEGSDDEEQKPHNDHENDEGSHGPGGYNDYNQGNGNYAVAGAFAVAGRKDH